jgi:hypothetical protein
MDEAYLLKQCRRCGQFKWLTDYYDGNGTEGKQAYCKPCISEICKEYQTQLKREVMAAYGGSCHCCGEATLEFLCLDHIDRDGYKDGKRGYVFYLKLRKAGFPHRDKLRTACHNCNMGREANGGVCPHVK